jgi:hypothetical protein
MYSSAFFVMKSENIGWRGGRRGVEEKNLRENYRFGLFKEFFFSGRPEERKSINESRAFKFLIKKRFRRKIDAQRFANNDIERIRTRDGEICKLTRKIGFEIRIWRN